MENNRLTFVQGFIGGEFTASPSPFSHWLKGKLIRVEARTITQAYLVRADMTNPMGTLHGGVTAGMVDDSMGLTFFVLGLETFYPTVSLYVEFFASAREGETVFVETSVVRQGQTLINLKAAVINEQQKLLAQASSTMAVSKQIINF